MTTDSECINIVNSSLTVFLWWSHWSEWTGSWVYFLNEWGWPMQWHRSLKPTQFLYEPTLANSSINIDVSYRQVSASSASLWQRSLIIVTWCAERGGVRLLPQPRTPDHVCDKWAEVIPVPDTAAECRCATWQRRVCVRRSRTNCVYIYIFKILLLSTFFK